MYRRGHNETVSKTVSQKNGPWVRIPPSPPKHKKSKEVISLEDYRKKEIIKASIAIFIIVIAILITLIIILKYQVEGEQNMPFKLSKILVVSTAEGVQKQDAQEKWNLDIYQNNDVYFTIEKNEEYKEETKIESIEIKNIIISKLPNVGNVKAYMPNSSEGRLFVISEDTCVQNGELKFNGALKTNNKLLEIANQGGTIVIRFANTKIGNYISNDENEEIIHDGTLISKIGLEEEQIQYEVTFDLIINLENKSYVDTIKLQMPSEKGLIENGTLSKEIKEGFIFKRKVK